MRVKKALRAIFLVICCLGIAFVAVRFGPTLYYRFFGGGNTTWISERFGQELKEKNELVVFETTITGQETAKQNAWLLGTVQEVLIPYEFSIRFVVDLSQSRVIVNDTSIDVYLPPPKASYAKLTVDEEKMKKHDWLYPLTPERYAAIKEEIESRLFDEASQNKDYLDAAWDTAVKNMESLFQTVAEKSEMGVTCDIRIIMDHSAPEVEASPAALDQPPATVASPTVTSPAATP